MEILSPSSEVATRCGAGSDSGVEIGASSPFCGAGGGVDGYASGMESLVGGATSCDSSLLSFSGELEGAARGNRSPASLSPRLPLSPGAMSQSLTTSLSAPKLMTSSLRLNTKRSDSKCGNSKNGSCRRSEPRSLSQSRVPPSLDDGRWPSVSSRTLATKKQTTSASSGPPSNTEKRSQARQESMASRSSASAQQQQNTLDKYATLPRKARHVKVTTPPHDSGPRSLLIVSREPSLNRAASLRRQRTHANNSGSSGYRSDAEDVSGSSVRSKSLTRTLPMYPRRKRPSNLRDGAAQTVRMDPKSPEDMEAELMVLTAEHDKLSREVDVSIKSLLKEKEARIKLQGDVDAANSKMLHMLSRNNQEGAQQQPCELLSEIESRFVATSEVAAKNHKELIKAQRVHGKLTEEVEKAKEAASASKQQYLDLQEESNELIDFLTAEKSTLAESLKEAEDKIVQLIAQIESKDKDIERQQDECRHLVKLSEQRRQEIVSLQGKLESTERLLVSQGGTTTAASVALDELCSRLESLLPRSPATPAQESSPRAPKEQQQPDESSLEGVPRPDLDTSVDQRPLVGSESLQDLTQAIISCHSEQLSAQPDTSNPTLSDQASELDKLVSKVMLTFNSLIKQKEQCASDALKLKEKLESETSALMEANLQLEQKQHKTQQLEAAQRLAHQTSSDEISALKTLLSEKESQLSAMSCDNLMSNWKIAAEELNRQYLAIDKALDVLHKEQKFVNQNPCLVQMQASLEETNFRCVTLPALVPEELMILNKINNKLQESNSKISPSAVRVPEAVNGTALFNYCDSQY